MWAADVVDCMRSAKAAGMGFDNAWGAAMLLHPPGRREHEAAQLTTYGKRDESIEEFLHRATRDAWDGRRPMLRYLPGLIDAIAHDESVNAVDGRNRNRRHAELVA